MASILNGNVSSSKVTRQAASRILKEKYQSTINMEGGVKHQATTQKRTSFPCFKNLLEGVSYRTG